MTRYVPPALGLAATRQMMKQKNNKLFEVAAGGNGIRLASSGRH